MTTAAPRGLSEQVRGRSGQADSDALVGLGRWVINAAPATQACVGLTAPDPPVLDASGVALVLWFVTLSRVLRHRVLERLLGLDVDDRPAGTR